MPSLLARAQYVVLDTAHWDGWIRDSISSDAKKRRAAESFDQGLKDAGAVVLLSLHHLVELLKYQNAHVAERRLRFLQEQSLVAWIAADDGSPRLGNITDILAAEVRASCEFPGAGLSVVRERAARDLIRVGTGAQACAPDTPWMALRPYLWQQEERDREIAIIARTRFGDHAKVTIREFMRSSVRSPDDVARQLWKDKYRLAEQITRRGDRRLMSPNTASLKFYEEVAELAGPHPTNAAELMARIFSEAGVDISEIDPDTTMEEATDLCQFRAQMKVISEKISKPLAALKAVDRSQVPTWVIKWCLIRYGQDLDEHLGSDVTDWHIACLAPYADMTFVDKRTMENCRRASQRSADFASLMSRIQKVPNYLEIPGRLEPILA